jgi:hypothetical protein
MTPVPSSVSAPALIDPSLSFVSDSGYETRRALHSRPRRRYTLDYLGKTTQEMREIRDFLQWHRFGAGPEAISFLHPTAFDNVQATATVPVTLHYAHELVTGQYVWLSGAAPLGGRSWRITRLGTYDLSLDGSTAGGGITIAVNNYFPNVVVRLNDGVMESPTKLLGPERLGTAGYPPGIFSFSVTLEEVF